MDAPSQQSVFLAPGEYFVGDARYRVRTLLGSCVSITLWQPERRVGAMSHFLLAGRGNPRTATEPLDGRYGDEALLLMLRGLGRCGVAAAHCEAKLFGGGDMFPGHATALGPGQVGRRNGDAARQLLDAQGIQVVSHSLFGVGHRRIVFDIASGDVWARQEPTASDLAPLNVPAPARDGGRRRVT